VLALKGMLQLGSAPRVSPDNRHNLAPVDFVSEAIVRISLAVHRHHPLSTSTSISAVPLSALMPASVAAAAVSASASSSAAEPTPASAPAPSEPKPALAGEVFNVINPLPSLAVADIVAALVEWAGARGRTITVVPYSQWLAQLVASPTANALHPLRQVFEASGGDFPASSADALRHDNLLRYVAPAATAEVEPRAVTLESLREHVFPFLEGAGIFPSLGPASQ
jgi:hypothetical protein